MMKNLFFLTVAVALTAVFAGCNKNMDAPEVGVTINGVTWATRNVDAPGKFANNPQDAGMFYQWNRKKGWPVTGTVTGWPTTPASGTTWATANDPCPTGWRVPTKAELEALVAAGTAFGTYDGVNGVYAGSAPDRIFLPLSGSRFSLDGRIIYIGDAGAYWSSIQFDGSTAGALESFLSGNFVAVFDDTNKLYGFSIRCVKK